MTDEQNRAIKSALLQLLEPNSNGDVSVSTAISLKRIADKLAETPAKAPQILHRGVK
jgi:hypothetical protein